MNSVSAAWKGNVRSASRHGAALRRGMGRRGFTLVEMMVVIAIIAILAALLIPALGMAVRAGKNGAMYAEMDTLAMSIEAYKTKTGDYPPDFTDLAAVVAHIKKAYPRATAALVEVAKWQDKAYTLPDGRCPAQLEPDEAIVFWLGMLKNDPRNPLFSVMVDPTKISGSDPREPVSYFDFKAEQLTGPLFLTGKFVSSSATDLDGDGWPEYVPKQAPKAPYVYFDGRTLGGKYHYFGASYKKVLRPYRSNEQIDPLDNGKTFPDAAGNNPTRWIAPDKFQLIGAGLDGVFGDTIDPTSPFKQFPKPNYSMTPEEADNVANFASGKTIGDSVP